MDYSEILSPMGDSNKNIFFIVQYCGSKIFIYDNMCNIRFIWSLKPYYMESTTTKDLFDMVELFYKNIDRNFR